MAVQSILSVFFLLFAANFCNAQKFQFQQQQQQQVQQSSSSSFSYEYSWKEGSNSVGSSSWTIGSEQSQQSAQQSSGCVYGRCNGQPNVPAVARQIQRPPCFCGPQVCNGCAPQGVPPLAVIQGAIGSSPEPPELAQGCDRELPCIQTLPCTNCAGVQAYDQCVCYGPGVCVCYTTASTAVVAWQSKPACYCSPQICNNCIGVQPLIVIDGVVDYGDVRATSVSHGCDWAQPCRPTPPCPLCNAALRVFDQCLCFADGICTCWLAPRKPACYCTALICNKCFIAPGFPAQIINNKGSTSQKPMAIATGCDPKIPCLPKPSCRPCERGDLKFEMCAYFGPGLNACFSGRAGYHG